MKIGAAAFPLAAAIAVSALCSHWDNEANADFCAVKIEAAEAPITGPLSRASNDQLLYALNRSPPPCNATLTGDQVINELLGGIMIGFMVYVFGLLFNKFKRWAER